MLVFWRVAGGSSRDLVEVFVVVRLIKQDLVAVIVQSLIERIVELTDDGQCHEVHHDFQESPARKHNHEVNDLNNEDTYRLQETGEKSHPRVVEPEAVIQRKLHVVETRLQLVLKHHVQDDTAGEACDDQRVATGVVGEGSPAGVGVGHHDHLVGQQHAQRNLDDETQQHHAQVVTFRLQVLARVRHLELVEVFDKVR